MIILATTAAGFGIYLSLGVSLPMSFILSQFQRLLMLQRQSLLHMD